MNHVRFCLLNQKLTKEKFHSPNGLILIGKNVEMLIDFPTEKPIEDIR